MSNAFLPISLFIADEKTMPPVPTMLMLSTEGLLCPFSLLNFNPGVKQLVTPAAPLALEGERLPKPGEEAKCRFLMPCPCLEQTDDTLVHI